MNDDNQEKTEKYSNEFDYRKDFSTSCVDNTRHLNSESFGNAKSLSKSESLSRLDEKLLADDKDHMRRKSCENLSNQCFADVTRLNSEIDLTDLNISIKDEDDCNQHDQLSFILNEIEQEMQSGSTAMKTGKSFNTQFESNRLFDDQLINKQISEYALQLSKNGDRIKYLTTYFDPIFYTDGFDTFQKDENQYARKNDDGTLLKSTRSRMADFIISDQVSFETEGFEDTATNDHNRLSIMFQGGLFKKPKNGKLGLVNSIKVAFRNRKPLRSQSWPCLQNIPIINKITQTESPNPKQTATKPSEKYADVQTSTEIIFQDKNIQVDLRVNDCATQTSPCDYPPTTQNEADKILGFLISDYSKPSYLDAVYSNFSKENDATTNNTTRDAVHTADVQSESLKSNILTRSNSSKSDENTEAQTTTDFNGSFKEYEVLTPSTKQCTNDSSGFSFKPATHKYLAEKYIDGNDQIAQIFLKNSNESKKWIELTEEKLNILIGRTDAILRSLFMEDVLCSEDLTNDSHLSGIKNNGDSKNIKDNRLKHEVANRTEERPKTDYLSEIRNHKRKELNMHKKTIIDAFNLERERELNLNNSQHKTKSANSKHDTCAPYSTNHSRCSSNMTQNYIPIEQQFNFKNTPGNQSTYKSGNASEFVEKSSKPNKSHRLDNSKTSSRNYYILKLLS